VKVPKFDDDGDGLNFLAGKSFEEINALLIETLHQAALLPEDSTFPGDPPDRGVTISHDADDHNYARGVNGVDHQITQAFQRAGVKAGRQCIGV
jgi:hypothetical protein